MRQESDKNFMYIYDRDLVNFLRFSKNIEYNTTGLNCKTLRQFYQFTKTGYLAESIREYKKSMPRNAEISAIYGSQA